MCKWRWKQINKCTRILSQLQSIKLYNTPGNVALQAEKNKSPNCQELFSKTLPCYVHCNHCQNKIYEKTYKCCLFMFCFPQKYKKNIVRKDGMVKEQCGEVFIFFSIEWLLGDVDGQLMYFWSPVFWLVLSCWVSSVSGSVNDNIVLNLGIKVS